MRVGLLIVDIAQRDGRVAPVKIGNRRASRVADPDLIRCRLIVVFFQIFQRESEVGMIL